MSKGRITAGALGALALLSVGAWAIRVRPAAPPPPPIAPPPAVVTAAQPSPAPLPSAPEARARLLVLRALELLAEARGKDKATAASIEREAVDAGASLRSLLEETPDLWVPVSEVLCSVDDPHAARQVLDMISGSIDDASERRFADLLRDGAGLHARRVAVRSLQARRSSSSLEALVAAAQADPDPVVRLDALKALAIRRSAESSPDALAAIDDLFRRRAQGDPDLEVRNAAKRISGEGVPGDGQTPLSRPRRPKAGFTVAPPGK